MNNILYLEKRGCNFWQHDKINEISDVGNYRVCTLSECVRGKDGNIYLLEFTQYDRKRTRATNKRTGAPLKHPVTETVLENALYIHTQFHDAEGMCWRNCKLENQLDDKNYIYTLADILNAVNDISIDRYTAIEFVD